MRKGNGMATATVDQCAETVTPQPSQGGINGIAACASRPVRRPIHGIASISARDQAARRERHGGTMRDAVTHDRDTVVLRSVEPLVGIRCPAVSRFDSGDQVPVPLARASPWTERAIDVDPGSNLVRERDQVCEGVASSNVEIRPVEHQDRRTIPRPERIAQRIRPEATVIAGPQWHERSRPDPKET